MIPVFASALVMLSSASVVEEERTFALRLNSAIAFDTYRKCLLSNARKISPFGNATVDDAVMGARRDCAPSRDKFRSELYQGVRKTERRERWVKLLLANADSDAKAVVLNEWRAACRFSAETCRMQ